jgi:hypothetical protein
MKPYSIKSIGFMLALVLGVANLNAQQYFESFECCNITTTGVRNDPFSKTGTPPFTVPCSAEWQATNGSPAIYPSDGVAPGGIGGVFAPDGDWYGLLYACDVDGTEGLTLAYNFNAGNDYDISLMMRTVAVGGSSGDVRVRILLTPNAIAWTGGAGCGATPADPANSFEIFNQVVNSTTFQNFNIQACGIPRNYTRMWISIDNVADGEENMLLFDRVSIFQFGAAPALNCATTNILPKVGGGGDLTCSQVFDNGTNVGVGTTSPSVKLHTNGDGIFRGTTRDYKFVNSGGLYSNSILTVDGSLTGGPAVLQIKSSSGGSSSIGLTQINSSGSAILGAIVSGISENGAAGNEAMRLAFYTQTGGTTYAERMRITPAGNVGVGTTAPVTRLHVDGQSLWLTGGNGTALSSGKGLRMYYDNTGDRSVITSYDYTASANKDLIIQPNTGSRVGVGTTSPITKLHVNGQSLWLTGGDPGGLTSAAGKGLRLFYDNTNDRGVIFAHDYTTGPKDLMLQPISGSRLGIGLSSAPAAKLHVDVTGLGSTVGIRFQGLPVAVADPRIITSDIDGNLHYINAGTGTNVVASNCSTTTNLNFPYWNGTANTLSCSSPININTGTNGIGIGMTAGTYNIPACGTCGVLSGPTTPGTSNTALDVAGVAQAIMFFARSDERFKKDIKPIDNAAEIISKMNPVSYNWRVSEFEEMNLPASRHAGFIAQELMESFPEAVAKDENGYLSVSYDMIIPVAVQAIKQQQKAIEELRTALKQVCDLGCDQVNFSSLQGIVNGNGNGIYLEQNVPNPATGETTIKYFIPTDYKVRDAALLITDLTGKTLQTITNHNTGETLVKVSSSSMAAGIYNYSLVVDGKVIDTKKMVIK